MSVTTLSAGDAGGFGDRRRFNALAIYQKMPDPQAAIQMLGRAIAGSQMFGVENEFQGQIFALECLTRGVPPLTLAEEYHVIFGKLSMKTDKMLANFNERGGKHKVLSRTPDKAAVELTLDGQSQVFSFTWEEAQKEPFVYDGKAKELMPKLQAFLEGKGQQPKLKEKYATPRSRMQMLWARVISDGVRTMCPGVNSGRYTPEELGGSDEETPTASDVVEAEFEVRAEPVESKAKPEAKPETKPATKAESPESPATSQAETVTRTTEPGFATNEQQSEIGVLCGHLGLSHEQRTAIIAKRGVSSLRSLTVEQADEIIAGLKRKLDATRKAAFAALKGESQLPADATTSTVDGPCSQVQIERVDTLLGQLEQEIPGFCAKFKERYLASGRQKIAELTHAECAELIATLERKQMKTFFENSLKPKAKAEPATEGDAGN